MRELVNRRELELADRNVSLSLYRDDLSAAFPGMARFQLLLEDAGESIILFSTNTYEYPPLLPLDAEQAARRAAADWERAILAAPDGLVMPAAPPVQHAPAPSGNALILQGSPRPDGSCAVLAEWAAETAASASWHVEVIFVHDLDIRPCIGCYQCFNAGECTFDDDMTRLARSLRSASLLVVCSPVYTNTVPAGLKAVIDRAQAIRAGDALGVHGDGSRRAGVLLATAGRAGMENFDCVRSVVRAFMSTIGIRPRGEVLIDGMDTMRDVRSPELEQRVRTAVLAALPGAETAIHPP